MADYEWVLDLPAVEGYGFGITVPTGEWEAFKERKIMTYRDNQPINLDQAVEIISSVHRILSEQTGGYHSDECKAPVWECVENALVEQRERLEAALFELKTLDSKAVRLTTENHQLRALVHTLTAGG